MATTPDRNGNPMPSVWVPPPADQRAGPTPLQLVWTLIMVAFLVTVFIDVLINFL
jgi:hypothetical protein